MAKLTNPTGSLINNIFANSKYPAPEVGMGATRLGWTDRHPYTIVAVLSPTKIVVQEDNAKRTDNNGMSESQTYDYTPNPDAPKRVVTFRNNGRWVEQGESAKNGRAYAVGDREKYEDFSF